MEEGVGGASRSVMGYKAAVSTSEKVAAGMYSGKLYPLAYAQSVRNNRDEGGKAPATAALIPRRTGRNLYRRDANEPGRYSPSPRSRS